MKKTQVALAALALVASTAALAEGATLYGTIDASVTKSSGSSTAFSGSGQWSANVIGVRGTQDLTGDMKVTFNLEAGINSANGSRDNGGPNGLTATNNDGTDERGIGATGLFNRAANVGIVTSAGTITAGLQVTPFIAAATSNLGLVGNNFVVPYLVNAAAADGGGTGASATGGFFQPDAISYSNSINGLSFSVMTSTGSKAADAMNRYNGGSFNYAISESTNVYAAFASRAQAYNNWVAGIKHVTGDLTLAAQYIKTGLKENTNIVTYDADGVSDANQQNKVNASTYVLSVAYALGGGNTVGLNYSSTDFSGDQYQSASVALDGTKPRSITNLSFSHELSKSTALYAFYANTTNSALSSYLSTGANAFGVGIKTSF